MDDAEKIDGDAADVIVIGGGIAGLSAALSAAESGAQTVLLEKQPSLGGSTAMSGGLFAFADTAEQRAHGISDTPERLQQDLCDVGGARNDSRLLETYATQQGELYRWLKGKGISFGTVKLGAGQSVARSHHTGIHDVIGTLRHAVRATGQGRILQDRRAIQLIRSGSRVSAVVVDTPDGRTRFDARGGVVIATGGFSRSRELLETFAPGQVEALPYGGLGNTGDGLRMAWRLGAGFRDMGYISGTYGSHPETGPEQHELLCAFYLGAIIVNKHGQRFVDESLSYKVIGDACLRQPDGLGYQVFDSRVRAKSAPGVPLNDIDFLEQKGRVFRADSLDDLASAASIDGSELAATVRRYNQAVQRGAPDEFGRDSLCNHVGERSLIIEPPFYAYPAKTLMTSTYCGLTITPKAEVVDIEGSIIKGLYAAGEVTGGFHGLAPMTGASLGMGALFGRIAGREAARRRTSTRLPGAHEDWARR
ncbi:FAD-dependent oxidoreductase [Mycolicibacterium goodii]|uniref:FAD-dependent oxidoreductase 2 FAD-binding domain-containing protein n=1 Tax=Mycolicibacterium goodii TaxID=134601 RepID=A0A0K0WZB4_MYCGD|nr:hypothetical protein AFA91_00065 [Mycolicibacterium goodii]